MSKFRLSIVAVAAISLLGLSGCDDSKNDTTTSISGSKLHVRYQIVDNHAAAHGVNCAAYGADWASCNRVNITLSNQGNDVSQKDWAIYFHSIRLILGVENDQFKVTHVTGDLHKLEPTDKFKGLPKDGNVVIPLIVEYWQVQETDVMPRWYIVDGSGKATVIKNTDTENLNNFLDPIDGDNWKRTPDDHNILMTPVTRFERNTDSILLSQNALEGKIIPTPLKVELTGEKINLRDKKIALNVPELSRESIKVLFDRFGSFDIEMAKSGFPISSKIDASAFEKGVSGAYKLTITPEGANIIAMDERGVYYGVLSILSQLSADQPELVTMNVEDAPRFDYRGVFLDIGRNFKSKDVILRLIDQMASYKLNKFHFHVSDDEGWRLEIPGLPELTDIGSKRCHDLTEQKCILPQLGSGPESNNNGSGYLTRDDYIEIVKYARDRFIEVIPEIDMPAHARAAVVSMEARYNRLMKEGKEAEANEFRLLDPTDDSVTTSVQFYDRRSYLNPCLDSSVKFVEKIIAEVAKMHNEAGQPLKTWHYGGDEAKNIRFGAGFQDINTPNPQPGKGLVDLSKENHPWEKSQICQQMITDGKVEDIQHLPSYFAKKVSEVVKANHMNRLQAWQDGLKFAKDASDFATDEVAVNFWDTLYWGGFESANEWTQKGYQVIISNPDYVYFDMPYEVNPKERGYYWATRFNDERKVFSFAPNNLPQNAETSVDRDGNLFSAKGTGEWGGAYGISGQLWNESIRTDAELEYMAFPRLISLAERAWHQADWELPYEVGKEYQQGTTHYVNTAQQTQDWVVFANLIGQRELAKLDNAHIQYRLPVPGAKIVDGQMTANIVFPGLTIEYSEDSGNSWEIYSAPVAVKGDVLVRSSSPDSKRKSRAEKVQ